MKSAEQGGQTGVYVFVFDMAQAYECMTPEGLVAAFDELLPAFDAATGGMDRVF